MKHITRNLLLAVAFVAGLTTVSAQTVTVNARQKVNALPATVTNYLDDPFRYFDVTFFVSGATEEGMDVFLGINFTGEHSSFYARTKDGSYPTQPIHLNNGLNRKTKDELLIQIRNGRLDTNVDYSHPLRAQLLEEGDYQLCVNIYRWEDRYNPNPEPIGSVCPEFTICYSGSAPELVSPMASAHLALNGAMVVTPARKINFNWTPVISNCVARNVRFRYRLKVVKVFDGQNYLDAIRINPTVFSMEVSNATNVVLDTLRDIKVFLEHGALYVAQVQAKPISTNRAGEEFNVANDGNSQPMPFYWDEPDEDAWNGMLDAEYGDLADDDDRDAGPESEGVDGLTQWEGGAEEVSELDDILDEMTEPSIVPYPNRHFVESDGYYTLPVTNDLEVGLTAAEHESLKNTTYTIGLYANQDGDVESITAQEPLMSETLDELPESRTLEGWGAKLEQGKLYYLQLSSNSSVSYWKYTVADTTFYVNEMFAEHVHDTVSREFVDETLALSDGVLFQWGDDPKAPAFATPQWKAPVNRTGDDIYDPANYDLPTSVPEVQKADAFPVSWTSVKDVTPGDVVEYEVKVYELKSGQTLEEAVSENKVLVTRTVTNANAISAQDTKFFKVFSPKKTYVMTLSTTVNGESDTIYHFANGNEALPIVIKIVK